MGRLMQAGVIGAILIATASGVVYTLGGNADGIWLLTRTSPQAKPVLLPAMSLDEVPAMSLDAAGVSDPLLVSVAKVLLPDDEIVIGVTVVGEARAYLRLAFEQGPNSHVVNDLFGAVPVTVTHCDKTRCTRVVTAESRDASLDIHCGGWLVQQEMSLLVDGKGYPQSSKEIPLKDLPFVVTTWKEWLQANPTSVVYLGQSGSPLGVQPANGASAAAL